MRSRKSLKLKKAAIIVSVSLVVLLVILPMVAAFSVYGVLFREQPETNTDVKLLLSDFPGLSSRRYEFESNSGQILVGYSYEYGDVPHDALVIMAHGLGSEVQQDSIEIAEFFAQNGFSVFVYDATGYGESEGRSSKGFPQGIIDLSAAIDFAESCSDFKDLPIVLYGYSWGAYSASSVLIYHPEVKAAASISGFNNALDLIESKGRSFGGAVSLIGMPYFRLIENARFKDYAGDSSMEGFEGSDAEIFIVHSLDDKNISPKDGYDLYFERFSGTERFTFVEFEDRGHDPMHFPGVFEENSLSDISPKEKSALDKALLKQISDMFREAACGSRQ